MLKLQAAVTLRDLFTMIPVPQEPAGSADFKGTLRIDFDHISDFLIAGRVNAKGAGYSNGRLRVQNAALRAQVELESNRLVATGIQADALGAHFAGKLSWTEWRQVHVEGNVDSLTVAEAASIVTPRAMPWNGTLSGSVMLDSTLGENVTQASAKLGIAPAPNGTPIERTSLIAAYDQREGELTFGDSYITTPSTRLDASGALGRRMAVHLHTSDLGDVLAALPLLEDSAPRELPLKLNHGVIDAAGSVTGSQQATVRASEARLLSPARVFRGTHSTSSMPTSTSRKPRLRVRASAWRGARPMPPEPRR